MGDAELKEMLVAADAADAADASDASDASGVWSLGFLS